MPSLKAAPPLQTQAEPSKAKDKKLARKEAAQQAAQVDALIKGLKQDPNLLAPFPAFSKYQRRGVAAELTYFTADTLPSQLLEWSFQLTKRNMEEHYEACAGWGWNDKKKLRELKDGDARFLTVTGTVAAPVSEPQGQTEGSPDGMPLAFVHLRFEQERGIPVAYVYEIQVEGMAQGRGIGKFLMQLVELIARKAGLGAVMLTVFKSNAGATGLYRSLGYVLDDDSPGAVEPEGAHGYEILIKKLSPPAPKA